jgi:hypothetical protein
LRLHWLLLFPRVEFFTIEGLRSYGRQDEPKLLLRIALLLSQPRGRDLRVRNRVLGAVIARLDPAIHAANADRANGLPGQARQ